MFITGLRVICQVIDEDSCKEKEKKEELDKGIRRVYFVRLEH